MMDEQQEVISKTKEPKATVAKTTLVILNGVVFEQIYNPDKAQCQYVSWNEQTKEYVYRPSIFDMLHNIKYVPICEESKWVKNGYIPLSEKPEDYVSFKHLVDEINRVTSQYLDIPDERRQLNTYVIILSYMMEKLHAIPYLRALGFKGNGKSRFCDFYGNIAYKSINILLPNMSNIYRLLEDYHGTLVINEDTSPKKGKYNADDEDKDLFALLCSGFERGHPVPRSVGKKHDVEPFDPFGLKILSSYKPTSHDAYESRCINTEMTGTTRTDIPIALGKKFLQDTLHLRNMLLDFRLKNFNKDFAEYENQTMSYWVGVSNRVAQCIQPISFLIAFDPDVKKFLLTVAEQKHMEDITRDSESFDGVIFKTYVELVGKKNSNEVCIKELKYLLDSKYPDIKPRSIASSLKTLGFKTQRGYLEGKQETIVLPDLDRVTILSKMFLFPDERTDILAGYTNATKKKQSKII